MKLIMLLLLMCGLLALTGCTTSPPRHLNNVCHIFDEKDGWYDAAREAQDRWGSPIPVIMAFMHQESRFVAKAKPPRTRILWIFPGPRVSDAYGYSQAKDSTWDWYQKESGNGWSSRADFADAADFVGWYNHLSHRSVGLSHTDAYSLYLAYHEGHGGFESGSYNGKPWLSKVASKVASRANRYTHQLATCEDRFNSTWWWPF